MAHVTERGAGRFGSVAMLVTTITASAAISVALWSGGAFNSLICGGDCGASAVARPDQLKLDPVAGSVGVPASSSAELNAAAIHAAVADALDNKEKLGPRVGFAAVDPHSGEVVDSSGPGAFIPASTTKLLTAITVLSSVDPQQRFTTSVVRSGNELVLIGGGDPYLASEPATPKHFAVEADIQTLAARTASALRQAGVTSVQLDYNDSRFSGPSFNPAWEKSYRTEKVVTPISALWVDQGVVNGVRVDDPAASAADQFTDQLEHVGISVSGSPRPVAVPAGATPVASVKSATVARITEQMIASSDNEAAEVLLRQAAIGAGQPASFDGGLAAEADVLRAKGIDTTGLDVNDGSGLSRHNRIAPATLAQVIAKAAAEPRTASIVGDLPTANFSGSLSRRFGRAEDGRGVVRAKTGTLKDVHSLAGYVTDRNGSPIVFAVMIDRAKDIPDLDAEAALDQVPAALADCPCSSAR